MNATDIIFWAFLTVVPSILMWVVADNTISMFGLVSKKSADTMAKVLPAFFFVPLGLLLFLIPIDVGTILQDAMFAVALGLGIKTGYRSTRKEVTKRLAAALAIGEWGAANFERLDVNQDGVICRLDLARFAAQENLTTADHDMTRKIDKSFGDIGYPAVQASSSTKEIIVVPAVISLEDFHGYQAKKKALWQGWL